MDIVFIIFLIALVFIINSKIERRKYIYRDIEVTRTESKKMSLANKLVNYLSSINLTKENIQIIHCLQTTSYKYTVDDLYNFFRTHKMEDVLLTKKIEMFTSGQMNAIYVMVDGIDDENNFSTLEIKIIK